MARTSLLPLLFLLENVSLSLFRECLLDIHIHIYIYVKYTYMIYMKYTI